LFRVRGKLQGLQHLATLMRLTRNWPAIWRSRRQPDQLPALQFRNGLVLNHGRYDNPLLALDEVFIKRWYDIGPRPPAHATMLDVGANIGSVSLAWSAQSPTLRIHAYEPNPAAFDTLQRNVEANRLQSRVRTFSDGVGRTSGTLQLWIDVQTDLSTAYLDRSPQEGGRRVRVPVVTLDEAWRRLNYEPIWLLKIDTEGAEVDILEGASSSLLDAVQHAIVETHDNIYPGAFNRCRRRLEDAGFACRERFHPWDEAIIHASRAPSARTGRRVGTQ
jgi:FkbM family methyltransferase